MTQEHAIYLGGPTKRGLRMDDRSKAPMLRDAMEAKGLRVRIYRGDYGHGFITTAMVLGSRNKKAPRLQPRGQPGPVESERQAGVVTLTCSLGPSKL